MKERKQTLTGEITHENQQTHPVVQHLQREFCNAFVLYCNYKQYHWHISGPHFHDLHLMFDEFAKEVRKSIDPLAERIRMIGQDIEAKQLEQMQHKATVHSTAAGQTPREMLEEAGANLLVVIKGMRDGAKSADDSDDPGTVDLFSKIVQVHEKHEWFLRQVLKKNGLNA
jgi:starvation-inducible DNA-binding protein